MHRMLIVFGLALFGMGPAACERSVGLDRESPSTDAGLEPADASVAAGCCLAWSISWTTTQQSPAGGEACYHDVVTFTPCSGYRIERRPAGCPEAFGSCELQLPACDDPRGYDPASVNAILGHPEVVAALEAGIFYGRDDTPLDGVIFLLAVDGRLTQIGSPCAGAPDCVSIPPRLQGALTYLAELHGALLGDPACASLGP